MNEIETPFWHFVRVWVVFFFFFILILISFLKCQIILHSSLKACNLKGGMFLSSSSLIYFMFCFFEIFLFLIFVHALFLLCHKYHAFHGFLSCTNLCSLLENTIFISFWAGLNPKNLQRFTSNYLGLIAQHVSIVIPWAKVKETKKNLMWQDIQILHHLIWTPY